MAWEMVSHVLEHAERAGIRAGLAIVSPTGTPVGNRADESFAAADAMALPLLVAAGHLVDAGTIDSLPQTTSLGELRQVVTEDQLSHTMQRLGAASADAVHTTPAELATLISLLMQGEACSAAQSTAILRLMTSQLDQSGVGRNVPEGATWGSVRGFDERVANEVGFIALPGGVMVIAAMLDGVYGAAMGDEFIAGITEAALVDCDRLPLTDRPGVGCPYLESLGT